MRFAFVLLVLSCSSSPPKKQSTQLQSPGTGSAPAETSAHAPIDAAPPPPPDAPPDAPKCPPQNPKGCPTAEPNVNRPCDVKGVECVYDDNCCHEITYVCAKNKHFEAHIQRCN